MTLYEIENTYIDLFRQLEDAETDEEAAEAWAALDELGVSLAEKAEAYARVMLNYRAEAEALKAERARLERRQRTLERTAEGLKRRMLEGMERLDLSRIDTSIGRWRLQRNPPSCQVLDPGEVPEAFHVPQPDKIDSRAILKHYRETGELIDGVDIRQDMGIRFA